MISDSGALLTLFAECKDIGRFLRSSGRVLLDRKRIAFVE